MMCPLDWYVWLNSPSPTYIISLSLSPPPSRNMYVYISPNSVSTLRGSYSRSKGGCLIRVLHLVCGILPACEFPCKVALSEILTCVSTAQARTKCGSRFSSAALYLHVNFRTKWLGPGVHLDPPPKPLPSGSCEILTCVSTAQARTLCGSRFWPAAFYP